MSELKTINVPIKVKIWKENGIWLAYSKKYEVSAYGRTKRQVDVMFRIQIQEILLYTKPKAPKRKK